MSREIKFRAWDIGMKRMLHNVGVHPHLCCIHEDYGDGEDGAYTISPEFHNYRIMQFTGLHDKNGAEVYEGDVLDIAYEWRSFIDDVDDDGFYRGVVHFRPSSGYGLASVTTRSSVDGSIEKRRGLKNIVTSNAVVIGNVYEHPELLEVAE